MPSFMIIAMIIVISGRVFRRGPTRKIRDA